MIQVALLGGGAALQLHVDSQSKLGQGPSVHRVSVLVVGLPGDTTSLCEGDGRIITPQKCPRPDSQNP